MPTENEKLERMLHELGFEYVPEATSDSENVYSDSRRQSLLQIIESTARNSVGIEDIDHDKLYMRLERLLDEDAKNATKANLVQAHAFLADVYRRFLRIAETDSIRDRLFRQIDSNGIKDGFSDTIFFEMMNAVSMGDSFTANANNAALSFVSPHASAFLAEQIGVVGSPYEFYNNHTNVPFIPAGIEEMYEYTREHFLNSHDQALSLGSRGRRYSELNSPFLNAAAGPFTNWAMLGAGIGTVLGAFLTIGGGPIVFAGAKVGFNTGLAVGSAAGLVFGVVAGFDEVSHLERLKDDANAAEERLSDARVRVESANLGLESALSNVDKITKQYHKITSQVETAQKALAQNPDDSTQKEKTEKINKEWQKTAQKLLDAKDKLEKARKEKEDAEELEKKAREERDAAREKADAHNISIYDKYDFLWGSDHLALAERIRSRMVNVNGIMMDGTLINFVEIEGLVNRLSKMIDFYRPWVMVRGKQMDGRLIIFVNDIAFGGSPSENWVNMAYVDGSEIGSDRGLIASIKFKLRELEKKNNQILILRGDIDPPRDWFD